MVGAFSSVYFFFPSLSFSSSLSLYIYIYLPLLLLSRSHPTPLPFFSHTHPHHHPLSENTGVKLYDSGEIIKYLMETYGESKDGAKDTPWLLKAGPQQFYLFAVFLARPFPSMGMLRAPSKQPEKMIELWRFVLLSSLVVVCLLCVVGSGEEGVREVRLERREGGGREVRLERRESGGRGRGRKAKA